MQSNQQRISQLKSEIAEKQAEITKLESVKEINLRAETDERYYYVDNDGYIKSSNEDFHTFDNYRYSTLNYFQTKEQAEAYKEYLLALGKVTRRIWELNEGDKIDTKYHIIMIYNKLTSDWLTPDCYNIQTLPYMASKEIAEKIISECTVELDIIRKFR